VLPENSKDIMKLFVLSFTLYWAVLGSSSAHPQVQDVTDRLAVLRETIQEGTSGTEATDQDMHAYWAAFRNKKAEFEAQFDSLICTDPEKLRAIHKELEQLGQEVERAWDTKQKQLKELNKVLHHEEYSESGIANGNDAIQDECAGLDEYIKKANETAQEEKKELDEHGVEVIDLKTHMDDAPCPCVWEDWSDWSECSTTCGAGLQHRDRIIAKEAINGGEACQGDTNEIETCNEDVCCPVDCVWNEWEAWPACPSGCPVGGGLQEKTRTRTIHRNATCNGIKCEGVDFEKEDCSREEEVLKILETIKFDKNQLASELESCKRGIISERCPSP